MNTTAIQDKPSNRSKIDLSYLQLNRPTKCMLFKQLLRRYQPEAQIFRFASLAATLVEAIIVAYLLLCLWFGDDQKYSPVDPAHKLKVLVYALILPSAVIRTISNLLFRS